MLVGGDLSNVAFGVINYCGETVAHYGKEYPVPGSDTGISGRMFRKTVTFIDLGLGWEFVAPCVANGDLEVLGDCKARPHPIGL